MQAQNRPVLTIDSSIFVEVAAPEKPEQQGEGGEGAEGQHVRRSMIGWAARWHIDRMDGLASRPFGRWKNDGKRFTAAASA
jgi:hypothetical protein